MNARQALHALAALDRVHALHHPLDALDERRGRQTHVCAGCCAEGGGWQQWPCPTIQAIRATRATPKDAR